MNIPENFIFEVNYARREKCVRCQSCGTSLDAWATMPNPTEESVRVDEILRVISEHWEAHHR